MIVIDNGLARLYKAFLKLSQTNFARESIVELFVKLVERNTKPQSLIDSFAQRLIEQRRPSRRQLLSLRHWSRHERIPRRDRFLFIVSDRALVQVGKASAVQTPQRFVLPDLVDGYFVTLQS